MSFFNHYSKSNQNQYDDIENDELVTNKKKEIEVVKKMKQLEDKILSLEKRFSWMERDIEIYIKKKEQENK